jgi:glycosyltransferase involved in cell wall biosynthesis
MKGNTETDITIPLKISLVTPSYNQSTFLPSTIESVLNQHYPNLEYIIMDGGSTDGSIEIIRNFEHNIDFWISESDQGQSDAINKGWKRSKGDIVGYLNSDDLLLPGSLTAISDFFKNNKDVDFIYGNALYIDESGKIIGRLNGHPFNLRSLLLRKQTIPQPTMFFRRKLLDDVGYLNEEFHYTMDLDFWLRTALKHTMAYIPLDLAAMRMHSKSKTVSLPDLFYLDELKAIENFFSRPDLPRNIINLKKLVVARCYLRGADSLFKSRRYKEARQIAEKGLWTAPLAFLDLRIIALCLSIIIGYDFYLAGVKLKGKLTRILKE